MCSQISTRVGVEIAPRIYLLPIYTHAKFDEEDVGCVVDEAADDKEMMPCRMLIAGNFNYV